MADIVIIDDAQSYRDALKQIVMAAGHRPHEAVDGPSGLELVRKIKPALVLLDVVMPGMDGYAVCRTLKKDDALKTIPVAILSTKGGRMDQEWGKRQGADDYLVKPTEGPTAAAQLTALVSAVIKAQVR
jgi:twitching motility two-component system response regulator PilH